MASAQADKAERFLALHRPGTPLLMPNPWDPASAKLLSWLGFEALATTSGGLGVTLGRRDGSVGREEAIANAAAIAEATELPVSADFENAYADDPDGVAQTVRLGIDAGLAGCSVEDYTGRDDEPFYALEHARERIAAAAETAHSGPVRLALTARAENHLRGRDDIADTIARLQAYQEAGADVLFAAALTDRDDLRRLISSVDLPVSVIARPGSLPVGELCRTRREPDLGRPRAALQRARGADRGRPRVPRTRHLRLPRASGVGRPRGARGVRPGGLGPPQSTPSRSRSEKLKR